MSLWQPTVLSCLWVYEYPVATPCNANDSNKNRPPSNAMFHLVVISRIAITVKDDQTSANRTMRRLKEPPSSREMAESRCEDLRLS
jgi:hypothetical protein